MPEFWRLDPAEKPEGIKLVIQELSHGLEGGLGDAKLDSKPPDTGAPAGATA